MVPAGKSDIPTTRVPAARPAGNAASIRATAHALSKVGSAAAVVLVEGISDEIALETAAECRGRDLTAEQVVIVPIGGAHAIGNFLTRLRPHHPRLRLTGLCDLREEEIFRRALDVLHPGSVRDRADMERIGFHVCVEDLEHAPCPPARRGVGRP
ncbi:TOPRIM nucleotidyl transferase/hydrolase domain-containing protein [Melissospora conviva]